MLKLALVFFVLSIIAGLLGFTGIASGARSIAKVFFYLFLLAFAALLVFGMLLGGAVL